MNIVERGNLYNRVVTQGPLRESLLNFRSYRPHFKEGMGPLTRHDLKWGAIAIASSASFGFVASKLIMGGTP